MIFTNSIRNGMKFYYQWRKSTWWHFGRIVQINNTRVWETQDCIGIVWPEDSSEESRTWLSQIENNGEKKYRARYTNQEFWRQKWKFWMKETPWSRIQGQNSVYKEFLETVGNGSPTGSVLEETITVSATILIIVEKCHSRIRLRFLSCSWRREKPREPKVPVVECFDGFARNFLKGTCINSFCEKWHPPECLFHKTKSGCRFGEKCWSANRQVHEQPTKRSQKEWWQKCSSHVEEEWMIGTKMYGNLLSTVTKITRDRSDLMWIVTRIMSWNEDLLDVDHRAHDIWVVSFKTWSRRNLFYGRAQTCRNKSNVWNSRKLLLHATLKFETKIHRLDTFAQETSSAQPQRSKIWGSVSGGDRVATARCPRSSVEAGPKCLKLEGASKSNILLTCGK